ncbi:PA2169 family four-helix-bundle protein [Mucilaginibacter koreensis]
MENASHTVEVLNDLVNINNDRINGYEHATKEIGEGYEDLKQIFTRIIGECHHNKMALGTEIQTFRKDIEDENTNSGSLHRTWLDVKAFFTGHSERSVLEECEFGEDAIKKAYQTAIEDEKLPAYIKDILIEQQQKITASHDEIKALRDSVK